jgi:hypothetical protein
LGEQKTKEAEQKVADENVNKNAALVKELDGLLKDAKKETAAGKKAKVSVEELAALQDIESELKAKHTEAKAQTKVVKNIQKESVKAFKDVAALKKKTETASTKWQKKLTAAALNMEKHIKAIADSEKKMNKPKGTIDTTFNKIATHRTTIETNEAVLTQKQQEVCEHVQAIIDHIHDSRQAEIDDIVAQHVKVSS